MDNQRDRRPERRKYVRYQYPVAEPPMVEIEGKTFPVVDICDHSLRIQTPLDVAFVEGTTVEATIRFSNRETLDLSGTIVRQQGPSVVIFLSEAFPEGMIRV